MYRCSGASDTTGNKCWTSIKRETLDKLAVAAVRNRLAFGSAGVLTPDEKERATLLALHDERISIEEEQAEIGKMIGARRMRASTAGPALSGLSERLDAIDVEIRSIESRYALGAVPLAQSENHFERAGTIGRNFRALPLSEQRDVVNALLKIVVNPGRNPEERVVIV